MDFFGKYTFQSTNSTGPKMFLTSSSSEGQIYPVVSASSITELEKWILFQNADGSLTIQMGDLFFLSGIASVGWVVGNSSADQATPMKIVAQGNGQVSLQILPAGQTQWLPVRYSVNVQFPYLVFPIAGNEPKDAGTEAFFNFAQTMITPPLAMIQSSKNAQGFDFRRVDLSNADLSGVNCTGADFTDAILESTKFTGATLTNAIFVGARLDNTDFSGATLDGAFFTGTDVSKVVWGTAISARGTHFNGAVGIDCKIGTTDPNLHADFTHADFTAAVFSRSDFSNAYLNEATLRAVFDSAIFEGADFTSAQLGGLDRTPAADLSFTFMPNVIFSKANLFGVKFAYASIFGASTQIADAATMEQADFSNAYLEGIDLTAAALQGANFTNACMVGVDLTKAQLSPTLEGSIRSSLVGACLHGATFTDSDLTDADLTNATVAFSQGTLNVRYCNPVVNGPYPQPPNYEPLNYSATQGLDLTTMSQGTVCPNGLNVAANQQQGNSLKQMLTIPDPKQEWVPVSCFSSQAKEELHSSPGNSVVIETPSLVFRTFSLRHFRDLRRLVDDPAVKRHLFWNHQFTDGELKAMIHYWSVRQQKTGITSWPVYRKSDKAFVGIGGFAKNPNIGGVEVSLGIMPEFRGDPIVKELYCALLNHGFFTLGFDRIHGLAQAENIAIKRFESKFGFRFLRRISIHGMIFDVSELRREDVKLPQSSTAR